MVPRTQEAELFEAFQLFDKDASGFIDRDELGELMKALGLELSAAELNDMYTEMDPSGDGRIDFKEFAQASCPQTSIQEYGARQRPLLNSFCRDDVLLVTSFKALARDPEEQQTNLEMANAIFTLLDKSGDGKVSIAELKSALISMNPSLQVNLFAHARSSCAPRSILTYRLLYDILFMQPAS